MPLLKGLFKKPVWVNVISNSNTSEKYIKKGNGDKGQLITRNQMSKGSKSSENFRIKSGRTNGSEKGQKPKQVWDEEAPPAPHPNKIINMVRPCPSKILMFND